MFDSQAGSQFITSEYKHLCETNASANLLKKNWKEDGSINQKSAVSRCYARKCLVIARKGLYYLFTWHNANNKTSPF